MKIINTINYIIPIDGAGLVNETARITSNSKMSRAKAVRFLQKEIGADANLISIESFVDSSSH